MKLILLAATALIATPLAAQTSGSTGTSSPTSDSGQATAPMQTPPTDSTMPAQTDPAAPAPTDPAMSAPAPTDPSMASQPMAPMASTTTPEAAATAGGYQPSAPALQGTAGTGAPVVFRAAPSPTEAFPPPAPKASYPICKKGQYDGCKQRGGK